MSEMNYDDFFTELSNNLEKTAVQPIRVDNSIFHQINDIMNGTQSKFNSVSDVVDDMKKRSGLTAYLEKMSKSNEKMISTAGDNNYSFDTNCDKVLLTLTNIVKSTKGGLAVPAILEKLKQIHYNDCDDKFWDDPQLLNIVAKLNLDEKSKYPDLRSNEGNMGKVNSFEDDSAWNTDAFYGINA